MAKYLVLAAFTSPFTNINAGAVLDDAAYPNLSVLQSAGLATIPYVASLMDPVIAKYTAQLATNATPSLLALLSAAGVPLTPSGVSAGLDFPATFPLGSVAYGLLGSNLVHVAGTRYMASVEVLTARIVTGIKVLNGATVGTDNLLVELRDLTGKLIATSALAGALSAGADGFQTIAFVAPVTITPGYYFVVVQCNGTACKTRRIATLTFPTFAGSVTGAFGDSVATVVPPTGFTADMGPIAQIYT